MLKRMLLCLPFLLLMLSGCKDPDTSNELTYSVNDMAISYYTGYAAGITKGKDQQAHSLEPSHFERVHTDSNMRFRVLTLEGETTATCQIINNMPQHCHILSGHNLDEVMQVWYQSVKP